MTSHGLAGRMAGVAVRYGIVGAACALLNLAIVWTGTERAHLPYLLAAGATCFITIPVGFLLHRRVSFRKRGSVERKEWWRFLALQLSQFCIGLVGISAAVELLHMRPWIAMAVVSALMFLYGFLGAGTWVFAAWHRPHRSQADATSRPLRVLQVSTFFASHVGGLEVVADQLARRLAQAGVQLTWMAGGRSGQEPAASANLVIDRADYVDLLEHRIGLPAPIWNLGSLRRLWHHVHECDAVHVHDYLYMPSLAAILFARMRRRPIVLTQHIGDIPFDASVARLLLAALNRSIGHWALRHAAQVVFVGTPVMQYFSRFVKFRHPPLLISNGVDHSLYRPREDEYPSNESALRALFVGRFVEKKGVGLLRRCVAMPGIRWDFVGAGPMLDEAWAAQHPTVRLHGQLAPFAVAERMRAADVLVLPSKGEGFPLVVQEALSCGTPVLVSKAVGEAFPRSNPSCVWSVDLEADPELAAQRLTNRLAELRDDLARVRSARLDAQQLASQWSWDECVAAYLRIYERITVNRESPAA
jgi:glycosyltransferase involved in cell wall biosynthesis/putative flippase GtrA